MRIAEENNDKFVVTMPVMVSTDFDPGVQTELFQKPDPTEIDNKYERPLFVAAENGDSVFCN